MFGPAQLDQTLWVILILGILLGMIASIRLRLVYGKYSRIRSRSNASGYEAARKILDSEELTETPIVEIQGKLTDHYDLLKKQLCLSSENYQGGSISALGIAAHEAGHALQQRDDDRLLRIRIKLTPMIGLVAPLSIVLILTGFFLRIPAGHTVFVIGISLFASVTVFQLILLPIEFDANKRAMNALRRHGLVSDFEAQKISKVLNAAAFTYVAGLVNISRMFWIKCWR